MANPDDVLLVTTESVPGRSIRHCLGYVEGWREPSERKAEMVSLREEAAEMGANAVVALRWGLTVSGKGEQETFVYGTAVWLEPGTVLRVEPEAR
jgi:uncharacterized protein YbjQ (UPF0145 family)